MQGIATAALNAPEWLDVAAVPRQEWYAVRSREATVFPAQFAEHSLDLLHLRVRDDAGPLSALRKALRN